jgi:flagellar protein FlaG
MVGNFMGVTAEPARTSAPSVTRKEQVLSAADTASAGKASSPSGETLPVPEPKMLDVHKTVEHLNELSIRARRSLQFSVDTSSGRTVITVVSAATAEVIRQIPAEELLALARALEEVGGLLDALA